jgi:hypothetical protein
MACCLLLCVSSKIPNRKLLQLATGEGTKGKLVSCSFTTDVMHQFMRASIIQVVPTNLTNRFEQIGVSARVLKRSDGSWHRRRIPLPWNGAKSVDPLELGQLKMQRWTAKVDSIRSRLGSENEFDGITGCGSVESSSESKVGLLDSENGATLDGCGVCANKLTTAVAYASSWSSRLEFTQVCTEAMGDGSTLRRQTRGANLRRQRAQTDYGGTERDF